MSPGPVREDEDRLRLPRVDHDREAEVRGEVVADRHPGVRAVVGPVDTSVVLGEEAVGVLGVPADLVDALAELGVLLPLGHEVGDDAAVGGSPGLAGVVGAVHPARRHRHDHAVRVVRVREDRVDRLAAEAGAPLRPVRVVPQRPDELEGLAPVLGAEERGGLGPGVHDVGLRGATRPQLPHLLHAGAGVLGQDHDVRGLLPGLAQVVGAVDVGAPVRRAGAHQQPGPATASVDHAGVDLLHQEPRLLPGPGEAVVRPADPEPLAGSHQHQALPRLRHVTTPPSYCSEVLDSLDSSETQKSSVTDEAGAPGRRPRFTWFRRSA